MTATPLSTIIALARAGALEHAWYAFASAGYDRSDGDPAALNVKGRLLKDKALRARGEDRRRFYLQSAEAYQRSAELQPGTYPLINAATLSLLSGDRGRAEAIAEEVLQRIEREPDEPETPYWRAATVAEALLLLARLDQARSQVEAALTAAPRAWEDHASTLRQFILIGEALGADIAWLDKLRPPRSLSWSDPAAGAASALDEREVRGRIADLVARERIGFAFGSPVSPAGIVAAEAALQAGVELHLVLPGGAEAAAALSITPAGRAWRARYDALLREAETIHMVRPIEGPTNRAMVTLAEQIAAGAARLNAARLMSEALDLPLDGARASSAHHAPDRPGQAEVQPYALLSINLGASDEAGFAARLAELREVLAEFGGSAVPPHLAGDKVVAAFDDIAQSARIAGAVQARLRGHMPVRIAGHFGLIELLRDPFLDLPRPAEAAARIVNAIGQAAPPDTTCVSLDFAAALAAGSGDPGCAHWIGELKAFDSGTAIALYALRVPPSGD